MDAGTLLPSDIADVPSTARYPSEQAIRDRITATDLPEPAYVREGGLPPGSLFLTESGALLVIWKMHHDAHDLASARVVVPDDPSGVTEYTLSADMQICASTAQCEPRLLSLLAFKNMLMESSARDPRSLAGRVRGRLHKYRAADAGSTTVEPPADQLSAQQSFEEHVKLARAGALDALTESRDPLPSGVMQMLSDLRSLQQQTGGALVK